VDKHRLP